MAGNRTHSRKGEPRSENVEGGYHPPHPDPTPPEISRLRGGWLVVKKFRPLRPAVYGRAFLEKRVKMRKSQKIGKKLKNRGV